MFQQKFAMGITKGFDIPLIDQLPMLLEAGFDGYFPAWNPESDLQPVIEEGNRLGLILQSIHAPFNHVAKMWDEEEPAGSAALEELLHCLRDCARFGAPIMVCHAFIGFHEQNVPTQIGLDRFGVLVQEAERLGVKIAFENTEGEEYLAALMNAFRGSPSVGFCWDTGHELCYNGHDMIALYGDRLLCTHLNDNLGIKDFGGKITYHDDLHLLPFDGITDWDSVAERLDRCGFREIMTFELKIKSQKGRHDNDFYAAMPLTDYFAAAFQRACRLAVKRRLNQN